jgi:hypothetical protein
MKSSEHEYWKLKMKRNIENRRWKRTERRILNIRNRTKQRTRMLKTKSKKIMNTKNRRILNEKYWTLKQNRKACVLNANSYLPTMDLELESTKSHKPWAPGSPQQKEQYSQRGFSQIQRFPFQFWMNSKNLDFRQTKRNLPNQRG